MENKSRIIVLIMVLVAFIIGYSFIYMPSMSKRNGLEARLSEAKQKNELLVNVKQALVRIKNNEKALSGKKDESWLINKVSSIADESKIRVLSVEPQKKNQIGEYTRISVKVDSISSYHRLGKFISRLENSAELLKVDALEVKSESYKEGEASEATAAEVKKTKGENLLKISLIVSTYNVK